MANINGSQAGKGIGDYFLKAPTDGNPANVCVSDIKEARGKPGAAGKIAKATMMAPIKAAKNSFDFSGGSDSAQATQEAAIG